MFKTIRPPKTTVTVHVDGAPVDAEEGETLAAVILRQSGAWTRVSAISGERRAPFCMMGSCFECVATVDGVSSQQTCLIIVRDGMRVERITGLRQVL